MRTNLAFVATLPGFPNQYTGLDYLTEFRSVQTDSVWSAGFGASANVAKLVEAAETLLPLLLRPIGPLQHRQSSGALGGMRAIVLAGTV